MKKVFYILLLICLITSCREDEPDLPEVSGTTRTVTFNLSGVERLFGTSLTRASANQVVDLARFDVMFYLFRQIGGNGKYQLAVKKQVTEILFTMDVDAGVDYKYVIAAAVKIPGQAVNPLIVAKDYNTMDVMGGTFEVQDASTNGGSYLENCFFDISGNVDYTQDEAKSMNSNPEIFADGFDLLTSYDFHTPVDLVLKRQVGAVEFKITGLTPGVQHTFECAVPSDYYRLYLSQIVRGDVNKDHSSQNLGLNSDLFDLANVEAGDYYGKIAEANGTTSFLLFTKNETVTSGENYDFYMYMPYTIASQGTPTASLYYQGNANGSSSLGNGSLTLTIDGTRSYTYAKPFPVYRNKKSYFLLKGENDLECKLGNIGLDDDPWDGNN